MIAVSTLVLRDSAPGCPVRDLNNDIKTVVVGGTTRVRKPSQSIKRRIREQLSEDEVIFANGADLIHNYLTTYINNGVFVDRDDIAYNNVATAMCKALNTPYRKFGVAKSDEKGSLVSYDRRTLPAILEAIMDFYNVDPTVFQKKTLDKSVLSEVEKRAKAAYESLAIHPSKALFGLMATGGAAETFYGALYVGDAISVDIHAGDRDDFIARMMCNEAPVIGDDIFAPALNEWSAQENAKPNADTMNSFDIAANTFASPSAIDIKCLYKNLCRHNKTAIETEYLSHEAAKAKTRRMTLEWIKDFILAQHVGKQRSNMDFTRPSFAMIGIHPCGQPVFPMFSKPLSYNGFTEKTVMAQAIEYVLEWVQDDTFGFDSVQYYVFLANEYSAYAEAFERAGVKLIKARDLNEVIGAEVDNLVDIATKM